MPAYNIPEIAYLAAYRLLPHYAFKEFAKAQEMWTKTPSSTGPFYYLMACQMNKMEPLIDHAKTFVASSGALGDFDYYLMTFPPPPPIELSGADASAMIKAGRKIILAPHFSVIVRHQTSGDIRYLILGQAPMGGGTTFRSITADNANCNLGPGPAPTSEDFMAHVLDHLYPSTSSGAGAR
jgi:hypothetical protein